MGLLQPGQLRRDLVRVQERVLVQGQDLSVQSVSAAAAHAFYTGPYFRFILASINGETSIIFLMGWIRLKGRFGLKILTTN